MLEQSQELARSPKKSRDSAGHAVDRPQVGVHKGLAGITPRGTAVLIGMLE